MRGLEEGGAHPIRAHCAAPKGAILSDQCDGMRGLEEEEDEEEQEDAEEEEDVRRRSE